MKKSLLTESFISKMEQLNSNISFQVGNDLIEIEIKGFCDEKLKGTKEFSIRKNGYLIFNKNTGITILSNKKMDFETFYGDKFQLRNNVEDSILDYYSYSKELLRYITVGKNILSLPRHYDYELINNCFCSKCYNSISVYFMPESKEIGLLFGDIKKVIENPLESTDLKVYELFNNIADDCDKICDSIIDAIKDNVNVNCCLNINSLTKEQLNLTIKQFLSNDISKDEKFLIINKIKEIEKMYKIYQAKLQEKKTIEKELEDFCDLLESQMDIALGELNAPMYQYEKELEETKKRLKIKYGIK